MGNTIDWGKIHALSYGHDETNLVGSAPAPSFTGLLDTYSGAAAAYSLRQLSSTYSGSAVRVRRASDNAEQDIAFSNNELDTATLETFASGTDAFVTTWYDQSGNNYNATQTTAAYQPQIVSSGTTILDNGKPSLAGVYRDTIISTTFTLSTSNSFFSVNSETGSPFGSYHNIFSFGTLQTYSTGTNYQLFQGSAYDTGLSFDTQAVISEITNSGTLEFFKNGTSGGTRSATFGTQDLKIMGFSGGQALNGKMQELVIYDVNQSSNRTGIETNINDFYSIY